MHRLHAVAEKSASDPVWLPIGQLLMSGSPRLSGPSIEHVRILAESPGELPPVVVQRGTNRIIDGVHRVRAAQMRGENSIAAVFFDGDDEDAFVLAVRSNAEHGLPLSLADRKAAASRILRGHPHWSDRAVSSVVGLSPKTIGALRRTSECPKVAARVGRDGRVRPVDTSPGRELAGKLLARNPAASLRAISSEAEVSVSTVRDVRDRLRRAATSPALAQAPPMPDSVGIAELAPSAADGGPRQVPPTRASTSHTPIDVLRRLRADPSLRFSDSGRLLLRLLSVATLDAHLRDRLVAAVPAHCVDPVIELAAACVSQWQDIADRLDARRRSDPA
jgi:ParB-like chromosome segregation protein Spo0J